jgi:hypothetical protein
VAKQDAISDKNQIKALIAHSGTTDTADTVRVTSSNVAGAIDVYNLGPAGSTTVAPNLPVIAGTPSDAGTYLTVRLSDGASFYDAAGGGTQPVRLIDGTLTNLGTAVGLGTVTNLGSVTNVGTIKEITTVPTITTVSNLTNGTVRVSVGTIVGPTASGGTPTTAPILVAGTDTTGTVYAPLVSSAGIMSVTGAVTLGTLAGVGTLTNLGSVTNIGTIKEVANLATGTIATVASVAEVVKGTTTLVSTVSSVSELVKGTVTLVPTVTTVSNLTNGSVNLLTGTVTRVSTIGTLESGTTQINPVPVPNMLTFGTLGTAGGSFFATISTASGAGTRHFVSNIDIVVQSGTVDVRILAGSAIQGTGVLAAGKFAENAGISKRIDPAFATGTNSELIYHFVGAGTAFITMNYWKGT